MKWDWKEWAKAALIRAIRTFAQTFAGAITVGMLWSEIPWHHALSAAGAAFVYSIIMSLGGLPELKKEPEETGKTEPKQEET